MAKEDICHCSCGGANHGCLRNGSGEQPIRAARMMSDMHALKAVGTQHEMHKEALAYNQSKGIKFYFADSARESYLAGPAKIRKATESQIAKWPELAGYRKWLDSPERWISNKAPYLLWIKK